MNAVLTQEGAQPLDPGHTQPVLGNQSSMGQESPELTRTGDAKDSAKTKPATTASEFGPRQTMPTCRGPMRKLEPDFLQAANDMDLLVENSTTEQTQAVNAVCSPR